MKLFVYFCFLRESLYLLLAALGLFSKFQPVGLDPFLTPLEAADQISYITNHNSIKITVTK